MKLISLVVFCVLSANLFAQSYSDDFETYTTGQGIAAQSTLWQVATFGGGQGGPRTSPDANVVNDQSRSGDNAVYLERGSGRTGNPDVYCSFQKLLELGDFELTFYMYIPSGDVAYYSLQGSEQNGNITAFGFSADGNEGLTLTNAAGETLATTSYTEDQWLKMHFDIDLVNNRWQFFMDDQLLADFENTHNALASIRFTPILQQVGRPNNSSASYWIDDLSYSFDAYEISKFNAQLAKAYYTEGLFANSLAYLHCELRNLGSNEINSIRVGYVQDGILHEDTVWGLSLFTGNTVLHTFSRPVEVESDVEFLEVVILDVDGKQDDIEEDNTLYVKVKPHEIHPQKVLLVEAGTSTACGFCPSAYVATEVLKRAYGSQLVNIEIHSDDVMAPSETPAAFFSSFAPDLPAATICRNEQLNLDEPDELEEAIIKYLIEQPSVSFEARAELNDAELQVSVETSLLKAPEEGWKIACALVELGVQGDNRDYRQRNNYWSGAFGEMGGYEERARIISQDAMVYKNVLREYSPSFEGMAFIQNDASIGDSVVTSFKFSLNDAWNQDSLTLVVMAMKPDGVVDNAYQISLEQALLNTTGVVRPIANSEFITTYPNPAKSVLHLNFKVSIESTTISLYSLNGDEILTIPARNFESNDQLNLDLNGISEGIYLLQVQTNTSVQTKRIVIQ